MVHALFVPIFFANIGLKIDFIADFDIIPVAIITVIGISGRFLGAWIGVSITNVPKINRTIISIAHTPGGMMEIVVALLAFESGIITPKIFIAIVFSAVISSIITGPWMRRAFSRRKKVPVYQMLNEDTIIPQLHSTSVNDAIREMTAVQQGKMKEDLIDRIVIEAVRREEDWTTAIGVGVAIPHVRLKEIFVPTVIFAKSQNGIDWNSPDGKPVHYIYLLITPSDSNDIHVELLSQIAKAMNSVDNRNVLDTCRNTTDLKQAFQTILGR